MRRSRLPSLAFAGVLALSQMGIVPMWWIFGQIYRTFSAWVDGYSYNPNLPLPRSAWVDGAAEG